MTIFSSLSPSESFTPSVQTPSLLCPLCKIRLFLPFREADLDYLIYLTEQNIHHSLSPLWHNMAADKGDWLVSLLVDMKEGTVDSSASYEDQGADKESFIPLECTSCRAVLCFPLSKYDLTFLLNLSRRPASPSYLTLEEKKRIEQKIGGLHYVIAEHDCDQRGCFQTSVGQHATLHDPASVPSYERFPLEIKEDHYTALHPNNRKEPAQRRW